jgi:hypothetical protein
VILLRISSAILISTILGSLLGFSLSYYFFDSRIQNIQSELVQISDNVNNVNLTSNNNLDLISIIQNNIKSTEDNINNLYSELINYSEELENVETEILELHENISTIQFNLEDSNNNIVFLNNSLKNIESKKWHLIQNLVGNTDEYKRIQLSGESIRINWAMVGISPSSWIDMDIYFDNGTLWYSAGSSGIQGSFENEVPLEVQGDYTLWIKVSGITWWKVEILTYS